MSSNAFDIIVVPYELGRLRQGVGCGPEHLLARGALSALGSNGAAVGCHLVEMDQRFGDTGSGEADAAFEIIRMVAERVRKACDPAPFQSPLREVAFRR